MAKSPEEMLKAMIENLPKTTGKSIDEWRRIVAKTKLAKHREIVKYLKAEHGIGHGYANQIAQRSLGFYTQGEYDIAPLIAAKSPRYRFMELGRSCVLKPYRTKRTVELLWHGLWTYVREHKVDVMIGCASFEGVDPDEHAMALSFLYHNALATPDWRVKAHDRLYVPMNRIPKDKVNAKEALKALPPLIKGYLRLGAMIGDGAVIDRQFGTTDVLIIMPVEKIDPRYFGHFGAPDELESRVARQKPTN
jgi:putative hemolysin